MLLKLVDVRCGAFFENKLSQQNENVVFVILIIGSISVQIIANPNGRSCEK